jgi:hypothetical protein
MSMEQGNHRDLWLVTAVFCAVTVLFLRMGTCAVVLRSESLLVINPIGSKEVRYDGMRKVVAGPGAALEIVTVRDKSLVSVVFGGSLGITGSQRRNWPPRTSGDGCHANRNPSRTRSR